jgi:hypothetical protein
LYEIFAPKITKLRFGFEIFFGAKILAEKVRAKC